MRWCVMVTFQTESSNYELQLINRLFKNCILDSPITNIKNNNILEHAHYHQNLYQKKINFVTAIKYDFLFKLSTQQKWYSLL